MHPTVRAARVAGALYVLMGVVAPFSLTYVPGKLIERGIAAATARDILASQALFRLGTVGELVTAVNNVAALTLFRGADYLSAFDAPQRDALGMLFLHLHGQGQLANEIFWRLWPYPCPGF